MANCGAVIFFFKNEHFFSSTIDSWQEESEHTTSSSATNTIRGSSIQKICSRGRDGIEQRRSRLRTLQMQSFFSFSLLQIQSGRISSCKCKKCDFYLLTATHQHLPERNPNSGFKISRQSTCYSIFLKINLCPTEALSRNSIFFVFCFLFYGGRS